MKASVKYYEIETVRITAADYDPRGGWDGNPFSDTPEWLLEAIRKGDVKPHTRNHTDYTEWDVRVDGNPDLTESAGPGDYIVHRGDGKLCVLPLVAANYLLEVR